jgi:hypothetical protein
VKEFSCTGASSIRSALLRICIRTITRSSWLSGVDEALPVRWQALAERLALVAEYSSAVRCRAIVSNLLHSVACPVCLSAKHDDGHSAFSFASVSRAALLRSAFLEVAPLRAQFSAALLSRMSAAVQVRDSAFDLVCNLL